MQRTPMDGLAYSQTGSACLLLWEEDHQARDTDCACPEQPFVLDCPAPSMDVSSYTRTADAFNLPLPAGFHALLSPLTPYGPSVVSPAGYARWRSFDRARPLHDEFDRLLAGHALLQPEDQTLTPKALPGDSLTVWLHVTNACNLDCPYCFVRKSSQRMSREIGLRALQAIFHTARKHSARRIKIKYAGGEATLHFKLIRRLHAEAKRLAEENRVQLREVILTNGVRFRPEDAEWCAANGVKLSLSVDGVGKLHDLSRPRHNGRGSFVEVERTVDQVLLPVGLRPDVTMTVTGQNAAGAADVARWALLERGLPLSFNLYRANSCTASREELALEEETIVDSLLRAYAAIEADLPTEPFTDGLLDRVQNRAHSHVCGATRDYLVIDHRGKVSQCHMDLQKGHSLPTDEADLLPLLGAGPIRNLPAEEKEGCRDCSFRYRCAGGCPVETFRATGRWDVKSPNCGIYQRLLPPVVRLEGLRLMKKHGFLD